MLLARPGTCQTKERRVAIILAPYKIQNPSEAQNPHRNTPQIPVQNRNTENHEKYTKLGDFRIFFVIFLYFGFGGEFGVYFGVYFGVRRGFVFCMGRVRSQTSRLCELLPASL